MKKILLPAMFASMFLIACGGDSAGDDKKVENQTATQQTEKDPTFKITPDEYEKRVISVANELNIGNFKTGGVVLDKGEVNDTFTIQVSDSVGIVGVVDKNGELKDVRHVLSGKLTEDDMMSFLMSVALSARALNPDLPKEETAGVTAKMLNETIAEFTKGNGESVSKTKVVGDVRYSADASKELGIIFSFYPNDVKN